MWRDELESITGYVLTQYGEQIGLRIDTIVAEHAGDVLIRDEVAELALATHRRVRSERLSAYLDCKGDKMYWSRRIANDPLIYQGMKIKPIEAL